MMKKPEETLYGNIAIKAVNLIHENNYSPENAWATAVKGKEKCCPKGAFLGLCHDGAVVGVESNEHEKLNMNGHYAVTAVGIVFNHPNITYSPTKLWQAVGEVVDAPNTHNSQMHVVLALKSKGLLINR